MTVQQHWSNEKLRFVAITAFGALVGWITGQFWMCLAVTFCGYSVWLLSQARAVDLWLQKGAKRTSAPDTVGIMGHIEQLIFRHRQTARERKKRLKKIVGWYNRSAAALPDATVITTATHEIVWANEAAARHLGIVASRDADQRIDNLVRSPEFQAFLQHTASTGKMANSETNTGKLGSDNSHQEEELEMPSPQNRAVTLAVRRVSYADNLLLFSARDISARVRLREMRQAFVANASHELKTPLTVVNGHLELLCADDSLPAAARAQLATASQHTKRMTGIVTDLLTLSRLENQDLDESKTHVIAVAKILTTTIADVDPSALADRVLQTDIDPSLGLRGSEVELTSLACNLINNAIQHTPAGEKTLIKMSWHRNDDDTAQLSVGDNGSGIPAAHINRITERFYRVDSARSRENGGTGLGLSIVKHIVNRHDGTLQIRSTPGNCTKFCATFPATRIVTLTEQDDQLQQSPH